MNQYNTMHMVGFAIKYANKFSIMHIQGVQASEYMHYCMHRKRMNDRMLIVTDVRVLYN